MYKIFRTEQGQRGGKHYSRSTGYVRITAVKDGTPEISIDIDNYTGRETNESYRERPEPLIAIRFPGIPAGDDGSFEVGIQWSGTIAELKAVLYNVEHRVKEVKPMLLQQLEDENSIPPQEIPSEGNIMTTCIFSTERHDFWEIKTVNGMFYNITPKGSQPPTGGYRNKGYILRMKGYPHWPSNFGDKYHPTGL